VVRAAGGSTGDVCRRHGGPEHRPGAGRLPPGEWRPSLSSTSRRASACSPSTGTSTRVFAIHEQVGVGAGRAPEPFYHVIESPYEDFDDDFTRLRAWRDHARPERFYRDLERRRPQGLRGPYVHPRTRSDGVRDLDDAAGPGRSRSLARRAGLECAVAPVPGPRRIRAPLD
jgi:hypothetical protein